MFILVGVDMGFQGKSHAHLIMYLHIWSFKMFELC